MNKKLYNYVHRRGRRYWFYYHLKKDESFQKEATELDAKLLIKVEDGPPIKPTVIKDFDYLNDPEKEQKLRLIEAFQIKWNINWEEDLLGYLIRGESDDIPPSHNVLVSVGYKKDFGMFHAQISPNADREDFEILWLMFKSERERVGLGTTKRPRKYTFTKLRTAKAYDMWKMLRNGATWTEVVKHIDKKYGTSYRGNIRDAKDFLNSYGYDPR